MREARPLGDEFSTITVLARGVARALTVLGIFMVV